MAERMRFYAAVKDGRVVQSTVTARHYRFAVLHTGINGTFVTFHRDRAGATRATRHMRRSAPTKEIVPVRPTTYWLEADGQGRTR